jgi:opacity protein-like surface antigen
VTFDSATLLSSDRTFDGWFVGGGIDTRLAASAWFLRLEYRFSQFDTESRPLTALADLEVEPSLHTARLLLTYKFGGGWSGWGMQ